MTAALQFESVSFGYRRGSPVLEDVSLEVPVGETVSLVGPNGGGKTTLLRLALGLLSPWSGRVRVLGLPPAAARVRLGYMPQQVRLDRRFPIAVQDVVAMGTLRGPWPWSRADRVTVARVLDEVDLRDRARDPFFGLSGGQQQRVLIARALATRPEILRLDEPTAMVDPHVENQLLARLQSLYRQLTIVLVSHDIAFVQQLVERVICVNRNATAHPVAELGSDLVNHLYGEPTRAVHHHHDHPPA